MAAGSWTFPTGAKKMLTDGTFNLSSDTFYMALFTSSWATTTTAYSTTNEASGTGYTAGGQALTGVTLTETSGTVTWTCTSPVTWSASGGSLAAEFAAIYDYTDAGKDIVVYSDLNSPAAGDLTATNANFSVSISGSGIFTYT